MAAEEEAAEMLAATRDAGLLEEWLCRRESGEPLAWIVGGLDFCGRRLLVTRGVYVPRLQTEALARLAVATLRNCRASGQHLRAVDLCTGAGPVAAHLAAAVPEAVVVGVDNDERAVRCARRNGVRAVLGDLAEPLRDGSFDVVTAVPPYVPTGELGVLPADVLRFEPLRALDGGTDGLGTLRRVVAASTRLLRPGGHLLVELGGDEDEGLSRDLSAAGFSTPTLLHDEDGDLRALATQWQGDRHRRRGRQRPVSARAPAPGDANQ